jgi:beta-xylosidase
MSSNSSATRRQLLGAAGAAAAGSLLPAAAFAKPAFDTKPFQTPYKYGKLVLEKSGDPNTIDSKSVDCPFVFSANDRFYMTYVGFDGQGYQTGLAQSHDLVNWSRVAPILKRDPSNPITRYNIALMCILRDDDLSSSAPLKKVNGRYLGAWHAYPNAGYESGPAVIGLAWSDDLLHWELTEPILTPDAGGDWERGGLYKPYLVHSGGTYYLFYNAKNQDKRWIEATGLATSRDLKTWKRYAGNPILPAGPRGSLDDRFASDPVVVRHGKLWAMYYYGLSFTDGHARDLLALGRDPFHFTKTGDILVDVGPPGSVDSVYAHKPSVISWNGDLYHFYCAVSGKWPNDVRGISVARSRPWS